MNVGKRIGDDHADAISGYCPSGMFATGARAPVLSTYYYLVYSFARRLRKLRFVHHEISHRLIVSIITEVVHECFAVEFRVACGKSEITRRDNIVCIIVVNLDWDAS